MGRSRINVILTLNPPLMTFLSTFHHEMAFWELIQTRRKRSWKRAKLW
jgi:hypothetical protein